MSGSLALPGPRCPAVAASDLRLAVHAVSYRLTVAAARGFLTMPGEFRSVGGARTRGRPEAPARPEALPELLGAGHVGQGM